MGGMRKPVIGGILDEVVAETKWDGMSCMYDCGHQEQASGERAACR